MAPIADERLGQLAEVVSAAKVTPAAARVTDVPGTGPQLLGNLRRVDALLEVADGFSAVPTRTATSSGSSWSCWSPTATTSSGGWSAWGSRRSRATRSCARRSPSWSACSRTLDAGRSLRDWEGELPPELEPLTTKPVVPVVNGPAGIDLKLEAELAELPEEEAAEFREGESALDEVVHRLFDALGLITFFTAGETEARAGRSGEGRRRSRRRRRSIPTSRAASSAPRWCAGTTSSSSAATRRSARRGLQRLEGKTYEVQDGDVLTVRFNV